MIRRRAARARAERLRASLSHLGLRSGAAPEGSATAALLERLGEDGVAAVEEAVSAEHAAQIAAQPGGSAGRGHLLLAYGVHHRVPAVLERTGLLADDPAEEVHAMGRGPLAAGGSYYYADLVDGALREAGTPLGAGMRCLDFGCSSGRVVRVLAAAIESAEWHGCDPNSGAVEWARAHLPGIDFRTSPTRPPLPCAESTFDRVFAVSVWSHFAPEPALEWLGEMGRALRPGGALMLTTHGPASIAHEASAGRRSPDQLEEIRGSLEREGHWFAAEFGAEGDHGVVDPGWGTAFTSPQWLAARATPEWSIALYAPGVVEGNQDLWVLRPGPWGGES